MLADVNLASIARRNVLGAMIAAGATALVPAPLLAAMPERRLSFRNVHNDERADACYFSQGRFRADGIAELNHAMRDWRNGDIARMDPDLFDLLVGVREKLGLSDSTKFELISGYRSPVTNAMLHERSGAVASKSQHLLGKAADVHIPGVPLERLHAAGMAMNRGGVGFYPADNFVHLDTGPVRTW
jgi:uncharacterized protein YcbK (DUF882 family)